MTLSIALAARASMLDGLETFMNTGGTATLVIRQSNTTLVTFNLNATPFAAALADSIIITSPPVTATMTAAGTANNFSLNSELSVLGVSGTISAVGGGGDIQVPSVTVASATSGAQRLNTFIVRMASSGALSVEASLTLQ